MVANGRGTCGDLGDLDLLKGSSIKPGGVDISFSGTNDGTVGAGERDLGDFSSDLNLGGGGVGHGVGGLRT